MITSQSIEKIVEYIYDDIQEELGNILDYKKEVGLCTNEIYEKTGIPFCYYH